MELTRRHALAGAAALAATPLLPQAPARAAAPVADKQAPSFYRYKVGDAQVTAISDGVNNFALPDTFVLNVKKDEVNAALEKNFMPKDKMSIQFAPLVINTGGKLVVVDTGNGAAAFASSKGNVGQFGGQHGRRGLRSQGGRHGGDLALPRRPHQRAADRREHAGVPQCRGAGAGGGVEIFHGRRRDEPCAGRSDADGVQECPPRVRGGAEQEGHAL